MKEIRDFVLFLFIWILTISLRECRTDQMCTIFEFKCNNQKCIHKSWLCDKANDCEDGSDENNCSGKVPGKPAQVVVTVLNATSLRISWNPPEDKKAAEPVLFHVLTFRNTLSVQEQEIKVPGFQNSVSLYHLKLAGNFIFSIFAVNVVGRGMKSDDVMVKLKPQVKESSSLQAKAVNASSIKLSWSNFGDVKILGYFLQYRDVNGNKKTNELLQKINVISLQGTITEYEVHKNIQPSKMYRFTLQPFSKFGYEQVIGPVYVKTPERAPKPLAFTVSLSGSRLKPFVALEVTSQDANAKAYILRYGKSLRKSLPIREETVRLLPGNYRNEEIPIQPFFWYYFTLSKQANDGIWSREKSVWLRGPISGFTASSTADVVTLIWSRIDPEDNGDHYTVLFKAQGETHMETKLSVRSNVKRGFNLLNVANLRPATWYDFTIKRPNSVCQKNACIKITVKTKNEATISSKRCNIPCPKILAPICASDGNSYDNICQMKNAACIEKKEITFKHVGYCCYIICPKEGSSVCASDGNTYASACLVKQAACLLQKEITVLHPGSCCDQDCPKVDAPVCGSDSNSYDNICEMQKAACLTGNAISAKHFGNCCDKKCPITQHPVCADDGQTYASICLMENVACKLKKSITIKHRGKCHSNETCLEECKFHSKCQTSEDGTRSCRCDMECPKIASPVCGSDGNSYYNLCTLKKTSCLKKILITVENKGMCVDKCKRGEFKCKNNECILRSWICDGQSDCSDSSDEHPDLCDEEA